MLTADQIVPLASYAYPGMLYVNQNTNHATTFQTKAGALTDITLTAQAQAGQTGDIQDWKDSSGNSLMALGSTGYLSVIPTPNSVGTGATLTGVPGSSAISAQVVPQNVVNNTTGGTDFLLNTTTFLAFKFNSGNFTQLQSVSLPLKVDTTAIAAQAVLTVKLYSDVSGSPGALLLANGGSIHAGQLLSSGYTTCYAPLLNTTLTLNTDYWLVIQQSANVGNTFVLNTRSDVGVGQVATSPDGTTWTLAAGTQTGCFTVFAGGLQAGGFSSTNGITVFASSQTNGALRGQSIAGVGVTGTSVDNIAVNATSTYATGVNGTSTWNVGGAFTSTGGNAGLFQQSGTLLAANANRTVVIQRIGGNSGSFNYSGTLLYLNDAPVTSTSSGSLIQAQAATADVWNLARVGTVVQTETDAGTNAALVVHTITRKSSGSVANGFGPALLLSGHSDTAAVQSMGELIATWATAANASRKSRVTLNAFDTAIREGFRVEGSGTAPMTSVNGVAAVARQVSSPTATDLASALTLVNNLKTIITNFGVCT